MKRLLLPIALSVSACSAAAPVALPPITMAFERTAVVDAMAKSSVVDWSSATFASPTLQASRQERGQQAASYRVSATNFAAPAWTKTSAVPTTGVISNAVAYAFTDPVWQTGPLASDRLIYMTNAQRGFRNFFVVNPATGAPLNGTGWDALTLVTAPAGTRVDNSAVTLSTKGTQAMFVATNGYFGAVSFETATGVKQAGIQLTANPAGPAQQVVGGAPFINNSAAPGIDERMEVWCATTNAAGSVGTLHRLNYNKAANPAWTYVGGRGINVSGPAADGSAGTVTAAGFKTSPVAWMGRVYIGDTAGRLWEYNIATGTSRYWDLSPFSGVATDQILAPVAINIGNSDAVEDVFVSCGNRVFWIDPVSNAVVPSQVLAVDAATSTPGPELQGTLAGYVYEGTTLPDIVAADTWSVGSNFNVGNTNFGREIVGSYGYTTPTDGRPVSGYIKFNVPNNAYTGRLPVSASMVLTCDDYVVPNVSDAGSIFRASKFLKNASGQDTTTQWAYTNMTWQNQPRLLVNTPFSTLNGPSVRYQKMTWNVSGAVPRDGDTYSFVLRGNGKQYNPGAATVTAPGYYGAAATPAGYRPVLRVRCSNFGVTGAIKTQPILITMSSGSYIYVANSNALFQLDFGSSGAFANAANTRFSLLAAGRSGAGLLGPVNTLLNRFVQNSVTTALSMTGPNFFIYTCDENTTGIPRLNKFRVPFNTAANADDLVQTYNLPVGSQRTTPYLTWDFLGGSIYFADQHGTTSTLYRMQQ